MENRTNDEIRQIVREKYGGIAKGCGFSSELDGERSCCGSLQDTLQQRAVDLGYSKEEASQIPEGANLGLGCGNPIVLASLKQGEIVLDLGAGAGFDCCLAASRVGDSGKVIMAIKEAGFQDVEIMRETAFPMEFMTNDPTVKDLVEHFKDTAGKSSRGGRIDQEHKGLWREAYVHIDHHGAGALFGLCTPAPFDRRPFTPGTGTGIS